MIQIKKRPDCYSAPSIHFAQDGPVQERTNCAHHTTPATDPPHMQCRGGANSIAIGRLLPMYEVVRKGERRKRQISPLSLASALLAGLLAIAAPFAKADTRSTSAAPPTFYTRGTNDCFVLLRRKWPDVQSGRYSVCRAVLANLNRGCGQPVPYRTLELYSGTEDLTLPNWEKLPARTNLSLVKEVHLAQVYRPNRRKLWADQESELTEAALNGSIELWRADIPERPNDVLGNAIETIYRLDYNTPGVSPEFRQSRIMFSKRSQQIQSPLFEAAARSAPNSVFLFESRTYTFRYMPPTKRFLVGELVRRTSSGDIGNAIVCSIEYLPDHD